MGDSAHIRLTREELYERIWTTPVSRLAPQLGLSGVGLAKICKREHIPRPPRGYWAKKAAGKRPRKARLRKVEGVASALWFCPERHRAQAKRVSKSIADRNLPDEVPVPRQLTEPSPLVVATERALRAQVRRLAVGHTDLIRPLVTDDAPVLAVAVAPSTIDRALCVLDAACTALESAELTVSAPHPGRSAHVTRDNSVVEFLLCEAVERVPRVVSAAERRRFAPEPPDWDEVPTGRLVFRFRDTYRYCPSWRECRESERVPIERVVARLVRGVLDALDKVDARRAEEARRRQQEEEARLRELEARRLAEEAAERRRREEARVAALLGDVTRWRRAQDIRALVGTVAALGSIRPLSSADGDDLADLDGWTKWALGVADGMDPLVE